MQKMSAHGLGKLYLNSEERVTHISYFLALSGPCPFLTLSPLFTICCHQAPTLPCSCYHYHFPPPLAFLLSKEGGKQDVIYIEDILKMQSVGTYYSAKNEAEGKNSVKWIIYTCCIIKHRQNINYMPNTFYKTQSLANFQCYSFSIF